MVSNVNFRLTMGLMRRMGSEDLAPELELLAVQIKHVAALAQMGRAAKVEDLAWRIHGAINAYKKATPQTVEGRKAYKQARRLQDELGRLERRGEERGRYATSGRPDRSRSGQVHVQSGGLPGLGKRG